VGRSSVGAPAPALGCSAWCWRPRTAFPARIERSGFSRSVSVIAGEGVKMERDYDFDSRVFLCRISMKLP
jgi:PmbA protein